MAELLGPPSLNHTHAASGKIQESKSSRVGMTLQLDIARQQIALLQQERAILTKRVQELEAGCTPPTK